MFKTKTGLLLKAALVTVFAAAFVLVSCEGPAGQNGTNGTNGKDGNEKCGVCHNNSNDLVAKQLQWAASKHATGSDFERNTNQCAPCHTSDGYREVVMTGADTTVATIQDPTGQNCRTCHNIHKNYDSTDWSFTNTAEVKLRFHGTSTVTTADLGKGNLCGKCHQSREVSPWPATVSDVDKTTLTSNRWGPHHSPVANMIAGAGGYDFGTIDGTTNSHKGITNACVTCHMSTAYGAQAGGHTMRMTYDSHGTEVDNIAACTQCHTSSTFKNFDYNSVQSKVKEKMATLRGILAGKNWLDTTASAGVYESDLVKASSTAKLTLTNNQAGALFNYLIIASDKSWGIHNPNYILQLLDKSIEVASK